jgi:predicted dienelactone hydrolase
MKRVLKVVGVIAGLLLVAVAALAVYIYATALKPTRPVGFQRITVADAGHPPISAAIWYPTDAKPGFVFVGSGGMRAASDAPVAGENLPLIVMSHGTGASALSHVDTALALAENGFVVVAPTHPGDNFQDDSDVGKPDWLANRARHLQRVVDVALGEWDGRRHIDPRRVGVFGFSAGATAALIDIGGKPDLGRIWSQCSEHPEFVCKLTSPETYRQAAPQAWQRDERIRAAVLAAPGLGFTFAPDGVSDVRVPVQLWAGTKDSTVPVATNAGLLQQMLGQRAEMHVVPGAAHLSFLMPCGLLAPRQICEDPKGFDRAAFHKRFNADVVRFFKTRL